MYTADTYKDYLKKVNLPNCKLFNYADKAYSSFFQQKRTVIDNIAPCKTKRVKTNTQKWFDRKVLENINTTDKLFKSFMKSRFHMNATQNTAQKMNFSIKDFFS